MIKKLIALAIGAGISLSASAGYVQYGFSGGFQGGGGVSGWFVQDEDTRAIAYYMMDSQAGNTGVHYFVSGPYENLVSAHNNFYGPGPTSFQSYVNLNDSAYAVLDLDFHWNAQTGQYAVGGWQRAPLFDMYGYPFSSDFRRISGGTVFQEAIDPFLLAALEGGQTDGLNPVIPRPLPEPGSLALLALGACGLAGLRRRRTAK